MHLRSGCLLPLTLRAAGVFGAWRYLIVFSHSNLPWNGALVLTIMKSCHFDWGYMYKLGSKFPHPTANAKELIIKDISSGHVKELINRLCVYCTYFNSSHRSALGIFMQCNRNAQQNACFVCLCAP